MMLRKENGGRLGGKLWYKCFKKRGKQAPFLLQYDKNKRNVIKLRIFSLKKLQILNKCHTFAL